MSALQPAMRKRRFATPRTIIALILREMSTTYGRTPGGYVWAVVEPVAGVALLTLVFTIGFHAPPLGINFPIFYATGLIPFLLYANVSGRVAQSIAFSKQLLAYPAVTYVDAILARFILNYLTQVFVAYIVFTGILLTYETRTALDLPQLALGFAMAGSLALGVGVMNCYLTLRFAAWQQIWSILNRPLFLISGLFFTLESLPDSYGNLLWFNPVIHVVGQFRKAFYPSYDAPMTSPTYVFALSLTLITLGLVFLHHSHRDFINQ